MHEPEEIAATRGPELPGQLTIEVRDELEPAFVAVAGEVDLLTAPRLYAALDEILRADARHFAIDLTETTFMDSAGIHALLHAHQRAGRHVAVICGPGPVLRALELLRLTEPLNVVSSLEEYKQRRPGS